MVQNCQSQTRPNASCCALCGAALKALGLDRSLGQWKKIMRAVDLDGDHLISYAEFIKEVFEGSKVRAARGGRSSNAAERRGAESAVRCAQGRRRAARSRPPGAAAGAAGGAGHAQRVRHLQP